MVALAENFSAKTSARWMNLLYERLQAHSVTAEQFEKIAVGIIDSRRYTKMPTIAEFITPLKGTDEDAAEVQAAKILEAIKTKGAGTNIVFSDPVTAEVVQARFGGWGHLCQTLTEETIAFFVRDFKEAYKAMARQVAKGLTHLRGTPEVGYNRHGEGTVTLGEVLKTIPAMHNGGKETNTGGNQKKSLPEPGHITGKGKAHRPPATNAEPGCTAQGNPDGSGAAAKTQTPRQVHD